MGKSYRFFTPSHLIFGNGIVKSIGEKLSALKSKRVLIVTDMGLVGTGLVDKIKEYICEDGRDAVVFSGWPAPLPSLAVSFVR